jgi:phosphoglycerate dehydrogenase-like enzyme
LTSAGYTRYDTTETKEGLRAKGAMLTNSSGVYDDPCAQHLLAMMLAQSRQIICCREAQHRKEWSYGALRPGERVLREDRILIVGYGAIGRRLAELLAPFRCQVRGIRRTPTGEEEVPCFPVAQIDEHLAWADHVVNILPAGSTTGGFFDARKFSLFREAAVFYNVGRGDTVIQDDLLRALDSGTPATAWLDVTSPEPLPSDHPLWSHPRVFISPHIAGGLQAESSALLNHFVDNLRRFEKGEPLQDRIV